MSKFVFKLPQIRSFLINQDFGWFLENTILIDVSSRYPHDIIDLLSQFQETHRDKNVMLMNGDVWRYGNSPELFAYFEKDIRKFYITTLEYTNKKIRDNVFEVSFPWFYFYRQRNDAKPILDKKCRYGFSSLNNVSSFHRLILGHRLWQEKMTDAMIFTQNLINLPGGHYEGILKKTSGMQDYIAKLPIRWPGEKTDDFKNEYDNIQHPAYLDAYCNIVTETEIQEIILGGPVINLPIVTEKSYKPLRSLQIPIWFAAPGHISYMRSLGFETMEEILPSGYDSMGIFEKTESIINIVKKGKEFIEDFYHSHHKELQHNYDLVNSDIVDNLILKNMKRFLQSS